MPDSSTTEIADAAERLSGAKNFFSRFPDAWNSVTKEVLKLETRQEYREPGNPSWELLAKGDLQRALAILPESREVDVPLYESLRSRGVGFVRCRPVAFPLTTYLQWELGCYEFNSNHGEEILFAAIDDVAEILRTRARHDFMVFDDDLAFIHDYDESGEIRGGWIVTDAASIAALQDLFSAFRQHCRDFRAFMARNHQHT